MKFQSILAVAALAGLIGGAAAAQTMRLAHNAAPGNPKAEASLKFAELVKQKTNGRITIDVGGSAQFGDDVSAITQMRLGTLAFSANSQGSTSGAVPEFAVLGLPFLFKDLPTAWRVMDGPVGAELAKRAEANGLVLLGLWDNGIRHVSNNVRPITSPADLAGIKLRTPPDPVTIDIFKALGANPAPLAFSELYVALQQGVMDGQENPLMNIHSSKLYEVQKFISLTAHKYESTPLLASKMVWDRISPADQAAIREAAKEAGQLNRQMSLEADAKLRAEIEKAGVKINEVDLAPFIAQTQAVYGPWREKFPALVDQVVAAARSGS
jgi:tripartite ATP-independent transporter DctP family solute receptor